MRTINTIIIGAGQAGLALSHCLTERGRDHLVIERGRVAERWRSERWDSLRLLTPNWMTRLPGWKYAGSDPNGFMAAPDVASFFDDYAMSFDAPVLQDTTVLCVRSATDGFDVLTDAGPFRAANVVIATGWCDRPAVPALAHNLSPRIHQIAPADYRRPGDVPSGGVLVVGASATGVQLADELSASGRQVTLAVGRHGRLPRRYRGMDIFWWLDMIGAFDKTIDDVDDVAAARTEPSLQLVGRTDHSTIDLDTLHRSGVRLVGRLRGADGTAVSFGQNLRRDVADATTQMTRLLGRIDEAIDRTGLASEVLAAEPIESVVDHDEGIDAIDLARAGIETVIWATGYRRPYEWLHLPIRDRAGEIVQYRGVTPVAGAYVLGQRFQHHRNSNFIDGVGRDARDIADHICTSIPNNTLLQEGTRSCT